MSEPMAERPKFVCMVLTAKRNYRGGGLLLEVLAPSSAKRALAEYLKTPGKPIALKKAVFLSAGVF